MYCGHAPILATSLSGPIESLMLEKLNLRRFYKNVFFVFKPFSAHFLSRLEKMRILAKIYYKKCNVDITKRKFVLDADIEASNLGEHFANVSADST